MASRLRQAERLIGQPVGRFGEHGGVGDEDTGDRTYPGGGVLRGCSDVPDAARIPSRAAGLECEPATRWPITLGRHRLDQRKHEWTDRKNSGQAKSTWLPRELD